MSGEEEFNIPMPMEILQMMLLTKIYCRVEYAIDNNFPVIPDGAVETVVNNIFKKLNDEQMSKGEPILNRLPDVVVGNKFMNELAILLHSFEESKETHDADAKREISESDKLTASTDKSVDTYFALRYRDLESDGEEIFKPAATLKYTPTVVDFCYLFRNLGPSSSMYKYQESSKPQEKKTELPTTETDEQKSSKTKKWGFKKFFAPLVSWMNPKPKTTDQ